MFWRSDKGSKIGEKSHNFGGIAKIDPFQEIATRKEGILSQKKDVENKYNLDLGKYFFGRGKRSFLKLCTLAPAS